MLLLRWFSQECIAPLLKAVSFVSDFLLGEQSSKLWSFSLVIALTLKEYMKISICKTGSNNLFASPLKREIRSAFSVYTTQQSWVFQNNRNVCWPSVPWEYINQLISLGESVAGNRKSTGSVVSMHSEGTRQKTTPSFPSLDYACRQLETLNPRKRWILSHKGDILVQTGI